MIARRFRLPAIALVVAILGWLAYQTIHAGHDIPPPAPNRTPSCARAAPPAGGSTAAAGRRLRDRDDDPDGNRAEIDNVRDGRICVTASRSQRCTRRT